MDELAELQAQLERCKQSNDWDQAVETIKRIVETQTDPILRAMAAVEGGDITRHQLGLHDEALEFFDMALDSYFADCDALMGELVPVALMTFEAIEQMLSEQGDWKALERAYRRMIVRVKGQRRFEELSARLFHRLGDVYRSKLDHAAAAEAAFAEATRLDPVAGGSMAEGGQGLAASMAAAPAATWSDDPRMNDPIYAGSSEPRPEPPKRSVEELKAALESPHYEIRIQAFDDLMKAFDLAGVMRPPEANCKGSVLEILRDFIARDTKAFNRIAREELFVIVDKLAAGASAVSLDLAWKPDDSPALTERMHAAIGEPELAFPVDEIRDTTGFTRRLWEGLLAMRVEADDPRGVDALVQLNAVWTLPVLEELADSPRLSPELREKIAGAVRYLRVSADAGSLN